jgi:predicted amidophosphoribosyltransferase
MACPVCKREFPPGSLFCPEDGTRLVKASGSSGTMRVPAGGICPTCERGFPPEVKICPEHGEALIPAPLFNATSAKKPPQEAPRGKICPTCGTRYDGNAVFCGKDGTALVLVN